MKIKTYVSGTQKKRHKRKTDFSTIVSSDSHRSSCSDRERGECQQEWVEGEG